MVLLMPLRFLVSYWRVDLITNTPLGYVIPKIAYCLIISVISVISTFTPKTIDRFINQLVINSNIYIFYSKFSELIRLFSLRLCYLISQNSFYNQIHTKIMNLIRIIGCIKLRQRNYLHNCWFNNVTVDYLISSSFKYVPH